MQKDKIIIRASSLNDYMDCSRRAATSLFRDTLKNFGHNLKRPLPGVAATLGTAFHDGAAHAMEVKLLNGEIAPTKDSQDRAIAKMESELQNGIVWDDITPNLNTAQKQISRQLVSFYQHVAPDLHPEMVEIRLQGDIGDDVVLSGQADVIEANKIKDYKTGKVNYHGGQQGAYSLLARSAGYDIKEAEVHYIPRTDLKKEQPLPHSVSYNLHDVEPLALEIVGRMKDDHIRFIDTGGDPYAFLPNPGSMLCSPKYCPAHGTDFCRHHKKTKGV